MENNSLTPGTPQGEYSKTLVGQSEKAVKFAAALWTVLSFTAGFLYWLIFIEGHPATPAIMGLALLGGVVAGGAAYLAFSAARKFMLSKQK